jgi:hypothetical protein
MKKSTESLLKKQAQMNKKPYIDWVKSELKRHDVRVHRWRKFNWEETYFAYFDSRRVSIPIPECKYSLLIALHEIGHIVKGERLYAYLAEYQAEKWAMETAQSKYGITYKKYENSAKEYVYQHLLEDVVFRMLPLNKIQRKVLKWIGVTIPKIRRDALKVCNRVRRELAMDEDLEVVASLTPRRKQVKKK